MNNGKRLCKVAGVVSLICVLAFFVGLSTDASYAVGPNVTSHSKSEIVNYLKNNNVKINDPVTFDTQPVKPGQKGELSTNSKNSALKTLNAVRYIAGLDNVSLDTPYGSKAQATAFVNWCIDELTHTPDQSASKPEGMSDSVWADGNEGGRKTNISYGQSTLNDAIVNGWMEDADEGNIPRVGHRMWCLNPAMGKTGFGATPGPAYYDKYYAMWSHDKSASGTQKNVVWPAQKMPVEYFGDNFPWSLATGDTSITSGTSVQVTLSRRSSSPSGAKTWTFSGNTSYTAANTGKYFNFQQNPNSSFRGQPGAYIIFRPDNVTYKAGDIFDVTVTGLGSQTISYSVEFFSGYPVESVAFAEDSYRLEGNSKTVTPTVSPEGAKGYEVSYSSSNTSVATVNQNGTVTRVAPGSATITATIDGRYTSDGNPKSASYTLKIPKPIDSSDITITGGPQAEYTGYVVDPFVLKDGSKVLKKGVDYELIDVGGSPLEPIEPNQYFVFFKGIGDYCDRTYTSKYLVINKKSITQDMITLTPTSSEYTGSNQKPAVTVKHGDLTLTEGVDYTLTNNGGIAVGNYNVTVTANTDSAHYRSSATKQFAITQKTITSDMIEVASPQTYTGSPINAPVTVTDGSRTLVKDTDYTLQYSDNTDFGSATVTVTGKGNYKGSINKTFDIAPRPITGDMVELSKSSFEYSGENQKPEVTVKYGNVTLVEGTDYILIDQGGTNINNYTLTVTGKGNFTSSVNKQYSITAKQITADMITFDPESFIYSGEIQMPQVTVKLGDKPLSVGTDYTVDIPEGKNAGSHTVTVTAKPGSNFTGEATKAYSIGKYDLNNADITLDPNSFTYDGSSKKPKVSLKINGSPVSGGYTVAYSDNVGPGVAKAIISPATDADGNDNFEGSKEIEFTITKSIAHQTITVEDIPPQSYVDGSPCNPVVTVKDGSKTLEKGKDYTVEYTDNEAEGTGKVKITGMGFYFAERTSTFEIIDGAKAEARDSLENKIDEIGNADTSEYSDADKQALQDAIAAAEDLLNRPVNEVSATDYDEALTAIVDAKATADANLAEKKRLEAEANKQEADKNRQEAGPSVAPNNLGPNTPDNMKPNAEAIGKAITSQKGDGEPRGATYSYLQAKSTKQTKSVNTLTWKKVNGATSYVVYGNKCGNANKFKKLADVKGTTYKHKKLKKGTYYKYLVVAVKGNRATAISKVVHVATKGKNKVRNYTKVTVTAPKKAKATIKRGKTVKIKAKQTGKYVKKHRKLCYESADPAVATVTAKGVVKGIKAGKTKIFVYTQNGISKVVTITIK